MATGGLDGRVKMWDVRTFRVLQEYRLQQAPEALDISQRGILAMGFGTHVEVCFMLLARRASLSLSLCTPNSSISSLRCDMVAADVEGLLHKACLSTVHGPSPAAWLWCSRCPISAL